MLPPTEVTVAQFAQFLNGQDEPVDDVEGWLDRLSQIPPVPAQLNQRDHGWVPVPGHGNRPIQSVTQVGANAYCAWRTSRLPTEAGREAGLDIDDSGDRVLRGSAWYHPDGMHDNVSATARFSAPPHYAAWYFGFRCVH